MLEEGDEVSVPAVLEGAKCVLILWDVVGKLHDDVVPQLPLLWKRIADQGDGCRWGREAL